MLKLNKALYGPHQLGKCWYSKVNKKKNRFEEIKGILCVYNNKNQAVIMTSVDDCPVFAKNKDVIKEISWNAFTN